MTDLKVKQAIENAISSYAAPHTAHMITNYVLDAVKYAGFIIVPSRDGVIPAMPIAPAPPHPGSPPQAPLTGEEWETVFALREGRAVVEPRKVGHAVDPIVYVHKKRGGRYEVLHDSVMLQIIGSDDKRMMVVYRSLDDGKIYTRPRDEFLDGRFTQETVGDVMQSRDFSTGAPFGARGEAVNAIPVDGRAKTGNPALVGIRKQHRNEDGKFIRKDDAERYYANKRADKIAEGVPLNPIEDAERVTEWLEQGELDMHAGEREDER